MRASDGCLGFAPRLPSDIGRLRFRLRYRGSGLEVETDGHVATYRLWDGPPLRIRHEGEEFELAEKEIEHPVTPVEHGPRPTQPPGREPEPRGPRA